MKMSSSPDSLTQPKLPDGLKFPDGPKLPAEVPPLSGSFGPSGNFSPSGSFGRLHESAYYLLAYLEIDNYLNFDGSITH